MKRLSLLIGCLLSPPLLACGYYLSPEEMAPRIDPANFPDGIFSFRSGLLSPIGAEGPWVSREEREAERVQAEIRGLSATQAEQVQRVRASADAASATKAAAGLPVAVREYTLGAVAWHADRTADALVHFRVVLALPPAQAELRRVWASYMEGRALARLDQSDAAIVAFERTRQWAAAGAADWLDLKNASLGEQARVHLQRGEFAAAVQLYEQQLLSGSRSARISLLLVRDRAFAEPAVLEALLADAGGRRLLVGAVLDEAVALSESALPGHAAADSGSRSKAVLDAMDDATLAQLPDPDKLGVVLYRAGHYELASRLAGLTHTPLAAWLRAKLALRAGDTQQAQAEYQQAMAGFPVDESWEPRYDQMDTAGHGFFGEAMPGCQVRAEAAFLARDRGDLPSAAQLLIAAERYSAELAELSEQGFSTQELRGFVDTLTEPNPELRLLLARRLLREGAYAEAVQYFDDVELRAAAKRFAEAIEATASENRFVRAQAWFSAASVVHEHGLALMESATRPAYLGADSQLRPAADWQLVPDALKPHPDLWLVDDPLANWDPAARGMQDRYLRFVAQRHAEYAADLLPPRSQAFAAVMCEATRWVLYQRPERAAKLYRRYLQQGPYVPWGEDFGQRCPVPDFAKAQRDERQKQLQAWRPIAKRALPVLLALSAGLLLIWWRLRRWIAAQRAAG